MESNSLRNSNILIDYNIKNSKISKSNTKNKTKSRIKKIKYFYIDSSELTKDETSNLIDKNIDNKNKILKNNNKKKIVLLKEKNNFKIIKLKSFIPKNIETSNAHIIVNGNANVITSDEQKEKSKKIFKIKNFKYFNKKDLNDLLTNKSKTISENSVKIKKVELATCNNNGEEELKQKEHILNQNRNNMLNKMHSFNEEDLYNKIKKINAEKSIINFYKKAKNSEKENFSNDDQKRHKNTDRIFNLNFPNINNMLNSQRIKIKVYTNMTKSLKSNIIGNDKKNIINKNNFDKNINNNEINFNLISIEKKNDWEDIPQRRPGCCTAKIINIENKLIHIKKGEKLIRNNFIKLEPKKTFTKSLKIVKMFNNKEFKDKDKPNLNDDNLLKNIAKKVQAQRLNNNPNTKIGNLIKNKNNINNINLKDNIYKRNDKNKIDNIKLNKNFNFTLVDSKNAIKTIFEKTLKRKSQSYGKKKPDFKHKFLKIKL